MQVTPHGGLANRCTRPLCDLSAATAGEMLSPGRHRPADKPQACAADALREGSGARIGSSWGDGVRGRGHVGSRSTPGLPAKPIIDMVIAITDSSNEPDYVPPMEAAGYVLRIREPEWFEHRLFRGPDTPANV